MIILVVSFSSASILPMICSVSRSTDEVGSSSKMILVFLTSARIKEILCFSPPEKILPFSPTFSLYFPGNFQMISCRCSFFVSSITSSSVQLGLPNFRLLITVPLNRQGCWETKVIWFLKLNLKSDILWPSNSIIPVLGSQSLNIRLSIVVFPTPLLPTIATKVFGSIAKLRLLRILLDQLMYLKETFLKAICP